MKRVLIHVLLLCSLLLAQQGAMLHVLSHMRYSGTARVLKKPALPLNHSVCLECVAFLATGGIAAPSPRIALAVAFMESLHLLAASQFVPSSSAPLNSRAPPLVVS